MDSRSSDNFFHSFLRNRKYWGDEFKRYRLERRYDNKVFGGEEVGSGTTDSSNDSTERFHRKKSPDGPHATTSPDMSFPANVSPKTGGPTKSPKNPFEKVDLEYPPDMYAPPMRPKPSEAGRDMQPAGWKTQTVDGNPGGKD